MTRIGVAFISDREGHLGDCAASVRDHLDQALPYTVIDDRDHHLGLAGAARAAWEWACNTDLDYLLHVEEDFRLAAPFAPLEAVSILETDKYLAQVVLKRQPWSPEEQQAGGIIECHPDDYTDRRDGDLRWVEHQRIFSLNPCLIPRNILEMGWPDGNEAEMTDLLVSKGYRFCFYGRRSDPPRVIHVGHTRSAGWRP